MTHSSLNGYRRNYCGTVEHYVKREPKETIRHRATIGAVCIQFREYFSNGSWFWSSLNSACTRRVRRLFNEWGDKSPLSPILSTKFAVSPEANFWLKCNIKKAQFSYLEWEKSTSLYIHNKYLFGVLYGSCDLKIDAGQKLLVNKGHYRSMNTKLFCSAIEWHYCEITATWTK